MSTTTAVVDASAEALMQSAHRSVYRWREDFPGFGASVLVDGPDGTTSGTIHVPASGKPEIDLGGDDAGDAGWARRELVSMIAHRRFLDFEAADGRHPMSLVEDDRGAMGQAIRLDDAMDSVIRIEDGRVRAISRKVGGGRFSLQIQAWSTVADGRELATAFTALHFPLDSRALTGTDVYRDAFMDHGIDVIPSERQMVSAGADGVVARTLRLRDVRVAEVTA